MELVKLFPGAGHYKDFLLYLQRPKALSAAKLLFECMDGLGTNDKVLIELVCTRSRDELAAAIEAYAMLYDRRCSDDIKGDTSGGYEKFLLAMLRCERDPDGTTVDEKLAEKQGKKLAAARDAGDSLPDALIEVLTSSSPAQLAAVAVQCGSSLEELIESATDGLIFDDNDLKKCLLYMLKPRKTLPAACALACVVSALLSVMCHCRCLPPALPSACSPDSVLQVPRFCANSCTKPSKAGARMMTASHASWVRTTGRPSRQSPPSTTRRTTHRWLRRSSTNSAAISRRCLADYCTYFFPCVFCPRISTATAVCVGCA